jgi:hypothetical protein
MNEPPIYRGTIDQPIELELRHVSEDEMVDLHEWLSSTLHGCGLVGAALDEALAGALRAVLPVLERERGALRAEPRHLRVVE